MNIFNNDDFVVAGFLMPHPPVIIEAVGKNRISSVSNTINACRSLGALAATLDCQTIVCISPHARRFSDAIYMYDSPILSGDFGRFGSPDIGISMPLDRPFLDALEDSLAHEFLQGCPQSSLDGDPEYPAVPLDHGVLVPLSFIAPHIPTASLVAISPSVVISDAPKLARAISVAANRVQKRTLVICSGDLSHRVSPDDVSGPASEGARFDTAVADAFRTGSLAELFALETTMVMRAEECGYTSLLVLASLYPDVQSSLLSYESPFGVGYCVASVTPLKKGEKAHEHT